MIASRFFKYFFNTLIKPEINQPQWQLTKLSSKNTTISNAIEFNVPVITSLFYKIETYDNDLSDPFLLLTEKVNFLIHNFKGIKRL